MQVAVDGPAGSGKSTISKILSERLSLIYLDTGAMYRASAWLKSFHNIDYTSVCALLAITEFIFSNNGKMLSLKYHYNNKLHVTDISKLIRTPEITAMVSEVAANKEIRAILTEKQREIAGKSNIIMDGRDIGTVVLPKAEIKIFLTASAEVRANRRMAEWKDGGTSVDYQKVLADIIERDKKDSSRETAPLKKADDAHEIDTSDLTIDQVIEIMVNIVLKYKNNNK